MARKFKIPAFYRSPSISQLKANRNASDPRKQDYTPTLLDFGPVRFKIARHFGFCFGVENAIEIAYRALEENDGRRVFLLSEMIHNPHVNLDLRDRGVRFILGTDGQQLVPFEELSGDDIVIVPAFGTTVELFKKLEEIGINPRAYNATCPFVEKVWKRADELGRKGFSIIVHGKHIHEETRATFSHARQSAPTLVIRDISEAKLLARYLRRELEAARFKSDFEGRFSDGFDVEVHLDRIGVVNQTTMLATETEEITNLLRESVKVRFGSENLAKHFADTRDTLCYATYENQAALYGLRKDGGDLAIVVGGYNSSNTSHLVELCGEILPTYHIKDADEILDRSLIQHLDFHTSAIVKSSNWLPDTTPVSILLTAGASCPDVLVDRVIRKVASFFDCEVCFEQELHPSLAIVS